MPCACSLGQFHVNSVILQVKYDLGILNMINEAKLFNLLVTSKLFQFLEPLVPSPFLLIYARELLWTKATIPRFDNTEITQ